MKPVQSILKRILDSKWAWDWIQGPIYNRLILKVMSGVYERSMPEVQIPKNARILDVGSGPGFITLILAQKEPTASVIGVDYSKGQVEAANRLRARKQVQNCSFRLGDAMALPFEDSSFDIVMSSASIKHWPDAVRGLKEIHRVLVPGGLAFIGEADRNSSDEEILEFMKEFTAWYVWDPFMKWYLRKVVYGRSYSRAQAESMAKSAGFSEVVVERVQGWPFFTMRLKK